MSRGCCQAELKMVLPAAEAALRGRAKSVRDETKTQTVGAEASNDQREAAEVSRGDCLADRKRMSPPPWRPSPGAFFIPARTSLHRSPTLRAQRAKLKSRRDDMILAQGKAKRRPGLRTQNDLLFFPSGLVSSASPNRKGKRGWV